MEHHYEILGVASDADLPEIREAYRQLSKEHHPDHGGSRERFLQIKESYEQVTGERAPEQGGSDGDDVSQGRVARDPTYDPETQGAERSYALTVEGDYLQLSLVGLAREVDLSSLLAGPTVNADASRTVAFFEVRNESDRVLTWEGRRHATFVGDDGFMYEGSSIVTPHDDRLPDRWCGTGVDVEPGRALDAVVIAEDLPAGVAARQVIYTQRVRGAEGAVTDTERYLFEIPPAVGRRLDHLPFDRE